MSITFYSCAWCLEDFAGNASEAKQNRDEHIEQNECGLIPRREREMFVRTKAKQDDAG